MRRCDVLLVDFDLSYTIAARDALLRAGASVEIVLAEHLTAESLHQRMPKSIFLGAKRLQSNLGTVRLDFIFCGLPIFGVCNGAQMLGLALGGSLTRLETTECGLVEFERNVSRRSTLQARLPRCSRVIMTHDYVVDELPADVKVTGRTRLGRIASFEAWRGAPV